MPSVSFGGVPAPLVSLANEHTLQVVTPPHLPGPVDVKVTIWDGSTATLNNGFHFAGENPYAESERILLPLLTPPVRGAFGSEFHTEFRAMNKGTIEEVQISGLQPFCNLITCIPWDPADPLGIRETPLGPDGFQVTMNGTPGRFVYVPDAQVPSIAMNLRVHDATRSTMNFGTEIPIVRERDFVRDMIVLPGVPGDEHFRKTLRIYATQPVTLIVSYGTTERFEQISRVEQAAGENVFEPAYAQLGNLPNTAGSYTVMISTDTCNLGAPCPGIGETDFWAFISVTNNETQLISTITPQP